MERTERMSEPVDPQIAQWICDLKNPNEDIRKKAVFSLGEKREKAASAVSELIHMLPSEPNNVIRNNIARTLGKIGDPQAVNALSEALFEDDYYVKLNAAWALGKIKDSRAVQPLLRLIKGGGAKVYTESGSDSYVDQDKPVTETLKTEGMRYHDVQINAIKALGEIKDESAVGGLVAELNDDTGTVRCAVALSLGNIGSEKAVPALIEALNDKIWYMRRDAAIALGQIGDPRAVEALIHKLQDPYEEVVEESVKAIIHIGPAAVAKTFLLRPKDQRVQEMMKSIFQSRDEIIKALMEVAEKEEDLEKRARFKNKINSLQG
ncbi:MAG: HEAT repeat domain-containing protein [Candidatus Lokiarchaeota archaeon]|nr:HEAT repeat domain-containing protein [Candidatus Lokiarchaeota archaeon]